MGFEVLGVFLSLHLHTWGGVCKALRSSLLLRERCSSTWGAHSSLGDAKGPLAQCLGVTPVKTQSNNPLGAQEGPFLTGTL